MTESMIPCTPEVLQQMMNRAAEAVVEYGLLEPPPDDSAEMAERFTDSFMDLLDAQGLTDETGDVEAGRCLVLPSQGPTLSLLLVTPCPVEEYDEDLRRKPSPVRFERTADGAIVLPGRWFLTKVEELADNPAAPQDLRDAARHFSRIALVEPLVLSPEIQTVAMTVRSPDGSETVLEALPGGMTLTMTMDQASEADH